MNFYTMGVINITPNSFSDGGIFNSADQFKDHFQKLKSWADIIDIGAESTAPFNVKVALDEELERFKEILFPYIENNPDPEKIVSIDTYKLEVFKEVQKKIKTHWPKTQIVFNDVSGQVEPTLINYLRENPDIIYVLSHNLVPTRDKTSDHMNYCHDLNGDQFLESVKIFFKERLEKFEDRKNIWIDPCFGFAKTREQNHILLRSMEDLLRDFSNEIPILYGISRKSFLRFPKDMDAKLPENRAILESTQTLLINELLKTLAPSKRKAIFRVHEPSSLLAIRNTKKIFENL